MDRFNLNEPFEMGGVECEYAFDIVRKYRGNQPSIVRVFTHNY